MAIEERLKKIVITVATSGRDVDMFRGRHSDYITEAIRDAALKLIQARNDVHGEGGVFKFVMEWQPEGWNEGLFTKAREDLHDAVKVLLLQACAWDACKERTMCRTHLDSLLEAIADYRVKREIKDAEDKALQA